MSKILISYRREDSQDVTGRIYDRLVQQFGREAVVKDVDSIPLGVDFRTYLDEQVQKCEIFLAVIGRTWMGVKGRKDKSRLDDPEDFVRIELEAALKRPIPVIPVLVGGTKIPSAKRLPASIQALSYRHGMEVRPDPDFHRDMDRLIEYISNQVCDQGELQAEPDTHAKPIQGKGRLGASTAPVDMVKVPKGPFLYEAEKVRKVIDYDYWIDKYLVTNEKYRAFVEVGGYETKQLWTDEGWQWRLTNNFTAPTYWQDEKWSKPDHPVVGVSYYEAEAYATWVGKRLPTEQEWEKAARGEDGRWYPWGDEWNKECCNSAESNIGHTTPVTQYPNGVSPYGCFDMAGNVWEWCASWYDEKVKECREIRGGSWFDVPKMLRTSTGIWGYATNRTSFDLGFRLVQDIAP